MDELPIGRYGTIHYMSNNGSEVPLASYPVDEDVINLGRSDHNTCHIRLIDPRCSDIHCKLIFEDGKAFLVVLGQTGIVIDGSDFSPSENESSPTTVPLTNGSEWLIFKRRFLFQYPPKEQRAKLMATPRKSRKSLRMSMINAAQVWTPSVPKSQEESMRALRAPLSPFEDSKDIKVTLVEGEPLHFAHHEEDIVVMENVDQPQPELIALPQASPAKVPQTPGKRGPPNLHRQVLLMNSHRKHIKRVDEQEEREVEESILLEEGSDEELEEDAASNPFLSKSKTEDTPLDPDTSSNSIASGISLNPRSFRASLGALGTVLPFGRPSAAVVHSPDQREKDSAAEIDHPMEPESNHEELDSGLQTPPSKRNLGAFLTPQAARGDGKPLSRQSVGGNNVHYMDLENDLEQARRRLAELGPMSRPQVVKAPSDEAHASEPHSVARSAKKPRHSLADVPDISSPLPGSKARFGITAMSPIPEPTSTEAKEDEDDDMDSAARLQRLMRTVESVARRESIRESRRGVVDPVDFYSNRVDPVSPTKTPSHVNGNATSFAHFAPSSASEPAAINQPLDGYSQESDAMAIDEQEDSSQGDATRDEIPAAKKGRKGAKTTTKRSTTKGKSTETTDIKMELDEPAASVESEVQRGEDVEMEDHSEEPKKKTRGTRKATTTERATAPRARGGKKAAANSENETDSLSLAKDSISRDDTTDDQISTAAMDGEEAAPATSRSRRAPRVKKEAPTDQITVDAPSTSTRRVGRSKATPASEEPEEASSTGSKATTSRTTARKPRVASRKAEVEAADSVQENGDDELDLISSDAPSRPATRKKGTSRAESSVDQSEEVEEPKPKKATRKPAATRKAKADTPPEAEKNNSSEAPEAAPAKPRRAPRAVKESVKVEEPEEPKPRRTTRTKR